MARKARFQQLFRKAGVEGQDVEWFLMWLKRYGRSLEKNGHSELIVEPDPVILFLQSLRDSG